jgi:large subunit ribosomal protein L4e
MKAQVYASDGRASGEAELPAQFSAEVRPDLIARAAISDQTRRYQPKGNDPRAGMETSARYRGRKEDFGSGKNRGMAIRPREVLAKGRLGKVRKIPSSVKGRRAHPPRVEKIIVERMNKKEYRLALVSAIAATAHASFVQSRGHKVKVALPIVVDSSFESLSKTADVHKALFAIIGDDLARCHDPKLRTGVRKRKGGKKYPKSAIIAVADNAPVLRAARNIPGIDAVPASGLTVEALAPGAKAGRLAIYSKAALDQIARL